MIKELIKKLEESRIRTVKKLESIKNKENKLLGRLEGLDLAIGIVQNYEKKELKESELNKELSKLPIVLDIGDDFEQFDDSELGQVIPFKNSK